VLKAGSVNDELEWICKEARGGGPNQGTILALS
jgi:hypothetical protein